MDQALVLKAETSKIKVPEYHKACRSLVRLREDEHRPTFSGRASTLGRCVSAWRRVCFLDCNKLSWEWLAAGETRREAGLFRSPGGREEQLGFTPRGLGDSTGIQGMGSYCCWEVFWKSNTTDVLKPQGAGGTMQESSSVPPKLTLFLEIITKK